VIAWDTETAAKKAEQAYRYVSRTLAPGADYSALDGHTEAAYEVERRGDMPAYLDALRELMRTARREAERWGRTADEMDRIGDTLEDGAA
jgi:hypothetical protein